MLALGDVSGCQIDGVDAVLRRFGDIGGVARDRNSGVGVLALSVAVPGTDNGVRGGDGFRLGVEDMDSAVGSDDVSEVSRSSCDTAPGVFGTFGQLHDVEGLGYGVDDRDVTEQVPFCVGVVLVIADDEIVGIFADRER